MKRVESMHNSFPMQETENGYIQGTLGLVITEKEKQQGAIGDTKEEWESLTFDHAQPTLIYEHEDGKVDKKTGRKKDYLPVGCLKKTWVDDKGNKWIHADFLSTQLGQQMRKNVLNGDFNRLSLGADAHNLGTKTQPYYKSKFLHVGICRQGLDPSAVIEIRASMSSGEGAKDELMKDAGTGGGGAAPPDHMETTTPAVPPSQPVDPEKHKEDMLSKFASMSKEDLAQLAAERAVQEEELGVLRRERQERDARRKEKVEDRQRKMQEEALAECQKIGTELGWSEDMQKQTALLFASADPQVKLVADQYRATAQMAIDLRGEKKELQDKVEEAHVRDGARRGYEDADKRRRRGVVLDHPEQQKKDERVARDISDLVKKPGDLFANLFQNAPSSSQGKQQQQQPPPSSSNALPDWLPYTVSTDNPSKDGREWASTVEVRQSGGSTVPYIPIGQTGWKDDEKNNIDYLNSHPQFVALMFSNPEDVEEAAASVPHDNFWCQKRANVVPPGVVQ